MKLNRKRKLKLEIGQIWEAIDLDDSGNEGYYWRVKIIHKTIVNNENRWISLKIYNNFEELNWGSFIVFNDYGHCISIMEDLNMDFYLNKKSYITKKDRI
jgi:hypothetical protein